MFKLTDNDTAEGKKLKKELEKLAEMEVRVGFQEGLAYPDGTQVVDVAMWNEMGTEHAPSRPFLRQSIDNNTDKIQSFVTQQAGAFLNGQSTEQTLKLIGLFQKDLVQKSIRNGTFEPNAESTIKAKGSSKPLIDTGLMRQSVNYVIKFKGGS